MELRATRDTNMVVEPDPAFSLRRVISFVGSAKREKIRLVKEINIRDHSTKRAKKRDTRVIFVANKGKNRENYFLMISVLRDLFY